MTPWAPPPTGGPGWQLPSTPQRQATPSRAHVAVLVVVGLGLGLVMLPPALYITFAGDYDASQDAARQTYANAVSGQLEFALFYWLAAIPLGLTTIVGVRPLARILLVLSLVGLALTPLTVFSAYGLAVGLSSLPMAPGNLLLAPMYGLLAVASAIVVRRGPHHGRTR